MNLIKHNFRRTLPRHTSRQPARQTVRINTRRRGAALLLLVMMVLLVVVAATLTLVRGEVSARRSEVGRLRARVMRSALDAAQTRGDVLATQTLTFPIDSPDAVSPDAVSPDAVSTERSSNQSSHQRIEIDLNPTTSQLTARWMKGDTQVDQMTRSLESQASPN